MAVIAAIQMVSGEQVEKNIAQAERLIRQAASKGARLVLLPENFSLLDSAALVILAEQEAKTSILTHWLSALAKELCVWIVAGSVPLQTKSGDGRVRAACIVFDDKGIERSRYDKAHLFDVDVADGHGCYRESSIVEHGDSLQVVDTPFGMLGLSICYDLRFPEMYQQLRLMGADFIVVPAAFTYVTGALHWEVLLRARAIEAQCFIIASNQGGWHSDTRRTWGHSMLIDANGIVLAEQDEGAGVVLAEFNLDEQNRLRSAMPVMEHRRKAGF